MGAMPFLGDHAAKKHRAHGALLQKIRMCNACGVAFQGTTRSIVSV